MDQAIKDKLASILSKQSEHRKAVADKQKRLKELEAKKKADRDAAERKWKDTLQVVRAVVSEINDSLKPTGNEFVIEERSKDGAISQTAICLNSPTIGKDSQRAIILNVDEVGYFDPVFLIPHSGKSPERMKLDAVDHNFFAGMLVDFLDQAFAYEDEKARQ